MRRAAYTNTIMVSSPTKPASWAAAIPAVVAYNRFSDQVNRLELRFETFVEEFSTILQRHGPVRAAQPQT